MNGAWRMVGRTREMSKLRSALIKGDKVVVVRGEAGIGKSTLLHSLVRVLESRGRRAEVITAKRSLRAVPLGALATYVPVADPLTPSDLEIRHNVGVRLQTRAPAVVIVDDAHLLDSTSAAVLAELSREGRWSLALSARSGELLPEAMSELVVDTVGLVLDLPLLDEADARDLVGRVRAEGFDDGTLQRILDTACGHPQYLVELARGADEGRHVPARLSDLVAARLSSLTPPCRDALDVAAFADGVEFGILEQLCDLTAVEELERDGLVRLHRSGLRVSVHVAHELHAEVLRAAMPATQQVVLARRLARALAATGHRRLDDDTTLADLRLLSGQDAPVPLLVRATRRALARLDLEAARRYGQRAVTAEPGNAEAQLLLAAAQARSGSFDAAEDILTRLVCQDLPSDLKVAVAAEQAMVAVFGRDDPLTAVRVLDEVKAQVEDHARPAVGVTSALIDLFAGDHASVRSRVHSSLPPTPTPVAPWPRLAALAASNDVLTLDVGTARKRIQAWGAAIAADPNPEIGFLLLSSQMSVLLLDGQVEDATDLLKSLRGGRRVMGGRALLDSLQGWMCTMAGHAAAGARLQRRALDAMSANDPFGQRVAALSAAARAHAYLGDARTATALARDARAGLAARIRLWRPPVWAAEAWALVARGDLSSASTQLVRGATLALETGDRFDAVLIAHDLVRLGRADDALSLLGRAAAEGTAPLVDVVHQHAVAVASDDGRAIRVAGEALAGIGLTLSAAEACARAAAAHQRDGSGALAWDSTERARTLMSACELDTSPVLALSATEYVLTERQSEIVGMAVRGMTSRQIAGRLTIATRTVDNHLGQAYQRLGVGGREELRTLVVANDGHLSS